MRPKAVNKKWFFISLSFVIALFAAVQIWSFFRDYSNPAVVNEIVWDSPRTEDLARRACFDCHSNETNWPWYARVYPMSQKIEYDVEEGRKVLNFSEWQGNYTQEQIDRMAEVVGKQQMPLPYYVVLHPEADLTSAERGDLTNGLIETFESYLSE